MKFTCDTASLREACINVQHAVPSKNSLPALEGILIQALGTELTLTGYDLEMGITTVLEARVVETGTIVLNARILCDILRKLPGEVVTIEADERNMAVITGGESRYNINGMAPDTYPELPCVSGGMPIAINQGLLKEMVRQTIFATATNDAKIVHTGVKFEISQNEIKLIAIDGFRLAIRKEAIEYDGPELSFVVPAKTLTEIMKLADDEDGVASICAAKRHIFFQIKNYNVISRLLEGEFMNYKSAIPTTYSTRLHVNTREFMESIDRTSLIITDKLKSPIRCEFDSALQAILISSITSLGTARDKVNTRLEGDSTLIGFNNRFLLDALRVCDTDEVIMELNGPVSPALILPPEGDRFLFLVLPVRLRNEN